MRRRIGIDVGGTNTDAVLLEGDRVLHAVKTPTTADVMTGVRLALAGVAPHIGAAGVQAVMIGTTHFVNAVVQRRDLARVGALRIGLPAARSLPPFCDWPEDLAALARGQVHMVEGGHDYDGRPIMPLDEQGVAEAARAMRADGIGCVAIAAIFSPLDASMERRAAEIVRQRRWAARRCSLRSTGVRRGLWPSRTPSVRSRKRPSRRCTGWGCVW
ncbi:hypothetical protein J4558_17910 [Leptolyngbya sp. 15MV]|nr:hypothetical protein J4558_17910 [Leptolyngbya sp. 15MV]